MRALGPDRLAAVVNTHGHWDHAFGNARFLPTPIWGHVRCATMILERGEEMRARVMPMFPYGGVREVVLTPPTELFDVRRRSISATDGWSCATSGAATPTTTSSSLVPDASVLFAGDLLENAPAPASATATRSPGPTPASSDRLAEGVVVPAMAIRSIGLRRGPGGPSWRSLAELAREVAAGAIGLDEAIRRSPFPAEPTGEALERARMELSE